MHRHRIVVTNRAFPETLAFLGERHEVVPNQSDDPLPRDELLRRVSEADAMVAFMPDRVDASLLRAAPRLRVVACALKGFDNFDVEACTRHGVWLTIVPDLLTEPTAELAIGLGIALGRRILDSDRHARSGAFAGWRPTFYGRSLDGSVVCIIGGGNVGRAIARKLAGFACEVLVVEPAPHSSLHSSPLPANARYVDATEGASRADFVFLAAPLTAATLHLIDAAWLARMKPAALLVNPARGSLVDEGAVAAALASGRLGGYAADVFECEDWARADRPGGIHPALIADRRTVFTTHIGSAALDVRRAIEQDAAINVIEALDGVRPHGAVNTLA